MKIVVAMSGGVDSSTTAGLLVEAGHEVIGLAMKTHALEPRANRACCTPDDMRDARRVADLLNIPFYVLNYAELFEEAVIRPFAEAYRAGRTPNPCVECNDKVKFKPLLERAQLLGADKLATGHYARIEAGMLHRAVDRRKDQSYFLYRLGQAQLEQLMFPLGHMTKDQVRAEARRLGLPMVAEKAESQEICFVGEEGYAATVDKILGDDAQTAGDIVNTAGEVVGRHAGVHHYTLGQRRGLGVAAAEPLYVTGVDAASRTVHVGDKAELLVRSVDIEQVRWTGSPPQDGELVAVAQRYREAPKAARVEVLGAQRARVHFAEAQPRGAPGQAAVVYRDEMVLGGGVIVTGWGRSSLPLAASEVAL